MHHYQYWTLWICLMVMSLLLSGGTPRALASTDSEAHLPLTKIVLYASGVGYFQRDGKVEATQQLSVRFKVQDVNDLLKSLVVQDFDGGQISAVTYDSQEPISTALKSFAINLNDNPTQAQLLHQLRGEPVEIATPTIIKGKIIGVETKRERVGQDQIIEVGYLNLLTPTGLQSVALSTVQRLVLGNASLNRELEQALGVLASGHDTQKKNVVFEFVGTGQRRVRIAYIGAAPVWKTSYRLVLSESQAPFLQGWAIIENTTDEDWHNLQLSLVSGRPVSFTMDMYTPLFVQRPIVVPELYTSLRPPEYDQNLSSASEGLREQRAEMRLESAPQERHFSPKRSRAASSPPPAPAADMPFKPQQGVQSAAQAEDLGELFEYVIQTPVSLTRQKSAMLPIVNEPVEGIKLSIYNEHVHVKHPLSGFRLSNNTALYLMQGPVTVFDGGAYAGDARLADLAPGQNRLMSYAIDLKTEVEPVVAATQREVISARLRKGVLVVQRRAIAEKTYTVRNRDQHEKTVLIEHPFRPDWKLTAPKAALERTRDVYRFEVTVPPNQTTTLEVREEQPRQELVRLMDVGPNVITHYLNSNQVSQRVKAALQEAVTRRAELDQTVRKRQQLEQRIATISSDQQRIRPNMERLSPQSELYARYVRKLDAQETEIEAVRIEIKGLLVTETKQRADLETYLLELELD